MALGAIPEFLHYPPGDKAYTVNVWYYHLNPRFQAFQAALFKYLEDEGIKITPELDYLLDNLGELSNLIVAEKLDVLVRRRVGFIQERLQEVFERNRHRHVDTIQIVSPGLILVTFTDGIRCEMQVDFSKPRYRRVRIQRTTQLAVESTLARNPKEEI